jgi:hypothetical protein
MWEMLVLQEHSPASVSTIPGGQNKKPRSTLPTGASLKALEGNVRLPSK